MSGLRGSSSSVQSVLISRDHHRTMASADKRLRELGFKKKKVDVADHWYRYRQLQPSRFTSFRIIHIAPDVMFVIGFNN